jgi:L-aspartate oxidase
MDLKTDILVLGSGAAGLTVALEAADHARVVVVSKLGADETSTSVAQGGVAAVFSPEDTFSRHVADTLCAGAGLCNREVVETCVHAGPARIRWLASLGVTFDRLEDSEAEERLDLGKEGGHSKRRIVHAKDTTGREIERVLLAAARRHPNVTLIEHSLGVDLITLGKLEGSDEAGRCIGCYVMDRTNGRISTIGAPATVLATGGAGKVYLYTSNPDVATGDGVAMAWRAGASIENMEFFQFHPTCLYHPLAKNFLITEAVRGEGGRLLTRAGRRFMPDYDAAAELAPRDVVARAMDSELKHSGDDCVYLDISHREPAFVRRRFPGIVKTCLAFGIDITKGPIPVVPAAHYQCGGVKVDLNGWTGLPGLYAVGEVACTGLHGANRLASNSLLEAIVLGQRTATTALHWLHEVPPGPAALPPWHTGFARHPDESVVISQNWDEIRRFMWNYVGLVRSDNRLARARKRLAAVREEVFSDYWRFILTPDLVELRNLADVAHLILEMAIARKESRGLHYNLDYPKPDDARFGYPSVMKRPKTGV